MRPYRRYSALFVFAAGLPLVLLSVVCPAEAEPNITMLKMKPVTGQIVPPPQSIPRSPYILPPLQYDHPYDGKLTIEEVGTVAQLLQVCKLNQSWALGCAFVSAGSCRIVLVKEDVMKEYGWWRSVMLRHEIGHCNGWPGDHPGTRRSDATSDVISTRPDGAQPAPIFYGSFASHHNEHGTHHHRGPHLRRTDDP